MRNLKILTGIIITVFYFSCGSNRLHEYDFREFTAAAIVDAPTSAGVATAPDINIDEKNPLKTILKVGTTIAKEIEAERIRARLDSATVIVDVPGRIAKNTLQKCSRYLHFKAIDNIDDADYLFDIYI